ncbi:MAG: chemotaxis protein CheR [Gammaproteobacteria bacterium RIFCSPLOWO2_02_FULL_61_13]|nr:MAG: chemotaxis protein CheR [Gammaproteobacteria bacterium RIFCSPLOWO2_02_FULL_61_13]
MIGPTAAQHEFELADTEFRFISSLVYGHAGIKIDSGKRELVYARLAKRLRALGLDSFVVYCERLRGDAGELRQCINALTTNVTRFFRESHHFDFLRESVIPELVEASVARGRRKARIWSAGCSSGEEPYTIELTLQECPQLRDWDVKILATDLDTGILAKARAGIYPESQIEDIPLALRSNWFRRGTNRHAGLIRVHPNLQQRIFFRHLNLKDAWPMRGPFDVIFCRNVVIYFDKDTQRTLFNRFADMLSDPGYLFLGHSENLHGLSDRFQLVGRTIYRKMH